MDALSRMHQGEGCEESKLTPLISLDAFLNVFEAGNLKTVEHKVIEAQQCYHSTLEQWEKIIPIIRSDEPEKTTWRDKEGQQVMPPDDGLKRRILREHHNHWGAGYPRQDETIRVQNNYF